MKKQSNTIQSKSEEIHEAVDKCILEKLDMKRKEVRLERKKYKV
jgi:hypothetical protein